MAGGRWRRGRPGAGRLNKPAGFAPGAGMLVLDAQTPFPMRSIHSDEQRSIADEAKQMTGRHKTDAPQTVLGRILLYARDIEAVARFYALHFGFRIHREAGDRIVELESPAGVGSDIMLHPLGRGRKSGQTVAKLVFDVPDVDAFCARAAEHGLEFGSIHKGDGYVYANARDPAGNSISVSSRAFRHDVA